MHLRRKLACIILAALLGAVLAACGAQGPESEPISPGTEPAAVELDLRGFDPASEATFRRLAENFADEAVLKSAILSGPPARYVGASDYPPMEAGDVWLALEIPDSSDQVARERAHWKASMLLAAFWREAKKHGTRVWGGQIDFTNAEGNEREHPGKGGYIFQADADEYLFRNADGEPAVLSADEAQLASRIRAGAEALSVELEEVAFTGALGTAVMIQAVTHDPEELIRSRSWELETLYGDALDLEGVSLTWVDPAGELVLYRATLTGLRRGTLGYGPKYASLDPRARAPAPGSATESP